MKIYQTLDFDLIYKTQKSIAMQNIKTARDIPNVDRYKTLQCSFYVQPFNALCVFTLDTGAHTSGLWKNPDYDTCWHLSISFRDMGSGEAAPQNHKDAKKIVRGFFQSQCRLLWCEPPYTDKGKLLDIWHYRLFIDKATGYALLPRGEIYSKEFTKKGWKSWSDVEDMLNKQSRENIK